MTIAIKVGAIAGQGAFVTGRTLCHIFANAGYNVFGYPEYPSLVRGGHNMYQVVVSTEDVACPMEESDILLAVDKHAILFHLKSVKKGGVVICDKNIEVSRSDVNVVKLDIEQIIQQAGGTIKMKNIALVSSALAILQQPIQHLYDAIDSVFKGKDESIITSNKKVAKIAYEETKKSNLAITLEASDGKKKYVKTGNEIIALGAIKGGLKFYVAYPMTPATGVLHSLIKKQHKYKIVVMQPEDEIAGANMATGAGFAGARVMIGTSGGGFALMTETVSMDGISETPIVYYVSQRGGPSTGMPTWTEQGDLFQILGAGQGEFPRIILAPGNGNELFFQTAEALNLAEEYQTPVFLLTDKYLSESDFTYDPHAGKVEIRRGKLITKDMDPLPETVRFKRYEYTKDGISPRPIPGVVGGEHVCTSYVHEEDSFTTENFEKKVKGVEKLEAKWETIRKAAWAPSVYENGGKEGLIVWGSQLGPVLEAVKRMKAEGKQPVDVIHFSWLYPLNSDKVRDATEKYEKLIIAENNATGLFEQLLKLETSLEVDGAIRKFNGRPFFASQIIEGIEALRDGRRTYVVKKEEYDDYEYYAPWRYE